MVFCSSPQIALCLSGQPRFFQNGYVSLKEALFKPNPNIDVFIHAWFDESLVGSDFDCSYWNQGKSDNYRPSTPLLLSELFNPKKMLIEKPRNFDLIDYSSQKALQPAHITFSMYYSIFKSNELKQQYEVENHFCYDFVVRARFDARIETSLDLRKFDNDFLYYHNDCPNPDGLNDQFAFSNSRIMDIYSSLIHYIEKYWKEDAIVLSNELMLKWHLLKNGIQTLRPMSFRKDNASIIWREI